MFGKWALDVIFLSKEGCRSGASVRNEDIVRVLTVGNTVRVITVKGITLRGNIVRVITVKGIKMRLKTVGMSVRMSHMLLMGRVITVRMNHLF